jgi:RHS repeat-associated protein
MFTDMLGSVRAVTSNSGLVTECYDYLPFGRMLSASDNGRGSLGCFQTDPDNQIDSDVPPKFTGKERDAETGLDYFGARYYSGAQGRFLSVDPENAGASKEDPQSWNAYAYGRNNPLKYTDPDGLAYMLCTSSGGCIYDYPDVYFYYNFIMDSELTLFGDAEAGEIYVGKERIGYYRHLYEDSSLKKMRDYLKYLDETGEEEAQAKKEEPSQNNTSVIPNIFRNIPSIIIGGLKGRIHFDTARNGERLIHYQGFRFNRLGQLVEHTGKVISEVTGKAARALKYLKNVKPTFFLNIPLIITVDPHILAPELFGEKERDIV